MTLKTTYAEGVAYIELVCELVFISNKLLIPERSKIYIVICIVFSIDSKSEQFY